MFSRRSGFGERLRNCGDGTPACARSPARPVNPADNPLGLCEEHLTAHRKRCNIPEPVECPACNPICVMVAGRYVVIPGAMCFACNATNGGTVASEQHRREAAAEMRARMLLLWRAGDRGPEWVALMARCPPQMREAFEARLAKVTPAA
jgi:hypothetical protein